MPSPKNAQDQTEPHATSEMTPEARHIIGKARRSFGFSIAILLLGFIAIVMALVYRAVRDEAPNTTYIQSEVLLPQGSKLLSVVPSEGRIIITYETSEGISTRIIEPTTGEIVADFSVMVAK